MDLMIDIETLGERPGCAIVSIAAVPFYRGGVEPPPIDFYVAVDITSCEAAGLTFEASTIAWWMARADRWPSDPLTALPSALLLLSSFVQANEPQTLWAHGSKFDFPILEAAYRACQLPLPWHHRQLRDTRTLFDLAGYPYETTAHHALDDARAQARAVQAALRKLREGL